MAIADNLYKILHAVYGRDVRQAIHDAIHDCYDEGKAGVTDLQAREDIETINNALDLKLDPAIEEIAGIQTRLNMQLNPASAEANEALRKVNTVINTTLPPLKEQVDSNTEVIEEHRVRLSLLNAHQRLDQVDVQFSAGVGTHTVNLASWNTENIQPVIVPVLNQDNIIWWLSDTQPSRFTIKFKNLTNPTFNGTVRFRVMFVGSV